MELNYQWLIMSVQGKVSNRFMVRDLERVFSVRLTMKDGTLQQPDDADCADF
jgi:hypothetical protein